MIDALRVIEDDTITLYLVNAKAPCFIKDENLTYTYLILPINFTR
jgi:DNA polymerase-3 subunit beta